MLVERSFKAGASSEKWRLSDFRRRVLMGEERMGERAKVEIALPVNDGYKDTAILTGFSCVFMYIGAKMVGDKVQN